jgi:transglutaminase-like putative cysteine protease
MRISIEHQTQYRFEEPVWHGVKRLRLTPRNCAVQTVVDWDLRIEGGAMECRYEDHNQNIVTLMSVGAGNGEITITCRGTVETRDAAGVVGAHTGFMPLWLLRNPTPLTKPGPKLRALAGQFAVDGGNTIPVLHDLMAAVGEAVAYEAGHTQADTGAEAALAAGKGVCQDHAHVFMGAARLLGLPARYVSGYLLMDDRLHQEAGHGWAEVHVAGLGWVGFDVSNARCPDENYVRLAVGADYRDAAPVTGMAQGGGVGALSVALAVQQQVAAQ